MGIAFRRARPGDAPHLLGLVEQLGYSSSLEDLRARLELVLAREDHAIFVAEEEGALLGWIHVLAFDSLATERCALVGGLVVDESRRRSGIGRKLVTLVEDWVRARGLSVLRLRSQEARSSAHRFYERLGFRLVKHQLQFKKEL